MNQRPRSTEPTSGGASGGRPRGQSDVLAIVLLLGMVFLGAAAVVVSGGFLIDSVQGNSEHELARDSAVQTHQQIAEAIESGQARELAVSEGIDMEVQQTGSITLNMTSSGGAECGYGVQTDLGAIVYDTPQGAVIYQGGAIWERTEAGLSIERNPPISYENDSARISVQTVSAEEDSFEGQMARPDGEMQETMAEETNRMLTQCPADGHTTLEIDVTSPNYAELWRQHFDERVDGPGVDVRGPDSSDTVSADIENATSAHASRGLRFDEIDGPDPAVIGDTGTYANHFNITTVIANDDFVARNASVELELGGQTRTNNSLVGTTGTKNLTLPGPPGPSWNTLNSTYGLNKGEVHEYTLRLNNMDTGEVASTTTGRFYLAERGGGNVDFFDDSHHFEDGEDTLVVNASLINTKADGADDQTVEFQITDDRVNMTNPASEDIDVPAFGGTKGISYEINVSALAAGEYEYQLHHEDDDETLTRNFTINSPPPGSGSIVGDLRVEDIEPSANYVEVGSQFDVRVQLYNTVPGNRTADVSLDVLSDASLATDDSVTVPGESTRNVTLTLDASELEDLATRVEHDYEISVEDEGGSAETFPGSFVLLYPDSELRIDEHSTETDGDHRWINATLANHGMDRGEDNAILTLYDDDTDAEIGTVETDAISLGRANATELPFHFNASELGGAYRYNVSYGDDHAVGYFEYDRTDTGDSNVSITAPGHGSVTVLGTEVSAYNQGNCIYYYGWHCSPSGKDWAPVSVSAILNTDGNVDQRRFNNTAADPANYVNETNLNTFDTQDATYSYNWTQAAGESTTLTVRSTLWEGSTSGFDHVNTRTNSDPSEPSIEDYQPNDPDVFEDHDTVVDASQGENSMAVRVLGDGDEVPNPQTSGEDQRNAREILNHGASDRIDGDELNLGPNEAVFLFELTEDPENYEDHPEYENMWDAADETNSDPDYNDVIALVSFNPDDPEDVVFDIGDHSLTIDPAPSDPDETNDTAEQDIDIDDTTEGPGAGSDPTNPDPQNPDPGDPSESDEIDVDVGGVVIG